MGDRVYFPCQCPTPTPISEPPPDASRHDCSCGGYYAVCRVCRRPLYDGGSHGAASCSPAPVARESRSKSHQWCDRHWAEMRACIEAGTHSGIAASTLLVQAWMDKRGKEGSLPKPHQTQKLNHLMRKDSPLCCTLGEKILADVFEVSRVGKVH